ncbi:unnamed protein product [Protopolystoma xenopodis]|uniref:GP-PDE domain-containing protein n=1 Tax=Protopolystoma xenopodis TaxID=117903 RepID=A0A3S5A2Z6_9PLAT|nr:unnamed protein product [Protopolystoma xenopodis]
MEYLPKPIDLYSSPPFGVDIRTSRLPMLIGHRGMGAESAREEGDVIWPENTIASFQRAHHLGIRVVELDALVTKNCKSAVVHHNFTVRLKKGVSNATLDVISC